MKGGELDFMTQMTEYGFKEASIEEHVSALFERISRLEPEIHAYITVLEKEALQKAKRLDEALKKGLAKGKLTGATVAVKDNICTKNVKTTCGSRMLLNFKPPYDATVVNRLEAEGAIIIGKTNMDEFAMGNSTETSYFGPTRNPFDLSRVPGGSSGGSGAALAAEMADLALGSDTGGSVRCPASFCGVVGLKPTYGTVSRYGLISYANSLEQIGPMARNVEACKLLFEAIAGYDPMDGTSIPRELRRPVERRGEFKVLAPTQLLGEGTDPRVEKTVLNALSKMETVELEVRSGDLPSLSAALPAYYVIAMSEASSNLARYDGVRYGHQEPWKHDWDETYSATRAEGFGVEVKRRIMLGTYTLSAGYYHKYYVKAQKVRTLLITEFKEAFKRFDLIAGPTMPILPFRIGEKVKDPLEMYMCDVDTVPANLTGFPAITIPCGFVEGLPVGLQLIAPPLGEELLFQVAKLIEDELRLRIPRLNG
jgi:aspartyl-tRNA(Asn)/glutamyl-tRNA(Gln) amidotransferase subunit A